MGCKYTKVQKIQVKTQNEVTQVTKFSLEDKLFEELPDIGGMCFTKCPPHDHSKPELRRDLKSVYGIDNPTGKFHPFFVKLKMWDQKFPKLEPIVENVKILYDVDER